MTFARYGFRKTSMEDLARASRVSRQALYNHFGSKAALADWAAQTLIENSLAQALDCLENPRWRSPSVWPTRSRLGWDSIWN
jgi:AcrR family transcriptional regulator